MATNEAWVLDSLALNDGTSLTLEAVDMTPPPELEEWIKGADSNGALLSREPLCDNRTITMSLRVEPKATMDLALAQIGAILDKLKECQRNTNGLALTYLPHDSAFSAITFRCLSGQIVGLPVDITSGWLVNAPMLQLKLTCLPFGEGTEVTSYYNESTNPGIEVSTAGYGTASSFRTNTGATLTRVTSGMRTGTASLRVVTTATATQGVDYVTVSVIAGQPKTISAWVKGNAGGEAVTMLFGDGTVGNASAGLTLTTSYQRLTVTLTPTATGTTGFAITQNTATVKTFFIDDVVIVNGSTAPTQLDGDMGTGYVWTGTTGLSASAGPNAVLTTDPIVTLQVSSVAGDVEAPGRLVVTDAATQSRRWVAWGMESRWYPTSSAPSLLIDSTSMVTTAFAGTTATRSGAYSGGSNNVIRGTLRTQSQAICGLGTLTHVGQFRPQLRVYASATTMGVRLTMQTLDGPFRSLSYVAPIVVGWNHLDLGAIVIPSATLGSQKWTGRIDAYSTDVGGETLDVDVMLLMPAERFGRARAAYAETPGVMAAYDQFASITATTVLNARAAPTGGSWATSGSTTDYTAADAPLSTDETETRATVSDSGTGRYAILGSTNYTNTKASVDLYATHASTSNMVLRRGVILRYVDSSNYLRTIFDGARFSLEKVIAGTATVLADWAYFPVRQDATLNAWLTIRLVVFASGFAIATWSERDSGVLIATLSAVDSTIATGGTLATGKPGILDYHADANASTRYYDNFYVESPADEPIVVNTSQSIEFRSDSTLREDSTGAYAGQPPEYIGGRFYLPPAGGPARRARVAAIARRSDVAVTTDDNIADSTLLQVSFTPRYLAVPYE